MKGVRRLFICELGVVLDQHWGLKLIILTLVPAHCLSRRICHVDYMVVVSKEVALALVVCDLSELLHGTHTELGSGSSVHE